MSSLPTNKIQILFFNVIKGNTIYTYRKKNYKKTMKIFVVMLKLYTVYL